MSKFTPDEALNIGNMSSISAEKLTFKLLEKDTQRSFVNFYSRLGEKPPTTIRFFDRIDFYTVHGQDDTEIVSKIIYGSTANVKSMAPDDIEPLLYLTLSKESFELAAQELLLNKNFRVEVYAKGKGNRQSEWLLEYKGSPGNLTQFEEMLFNKNDAIAGTVTIAVNLCSDGKEKVVGLALIDSCDLLMSLAEFVDNDFYGQLEAAIVLLAPRECIISSVEGDYAKIKKLMERNDVMVTVTKKIDFSIVKEDIIQDLNKLLRFEKGQQESAHIIPEVNKKIALSALKAAIKYMSLLNDDTNFGNYQLKLLNMDRYVYLDPAAMQALNILPKAGINFSNLTYRWQSILGVLDRCCTPQGHRLMNQWVKQPLRNRTILEDRHNIVQCFLNSPSTLQELHDVMLKRIPDVLLLVRRLMRKKAALQDMFRIYQLIIRLPAIISTLAHLEDVSVTNVLSNPLNDILNELKMLKEMIEQVVDMEGIQKGEYYIKAAFDPDLQEMKEKIDRLQAKMEKLQRKAIENLGITNLKLEFVEHLGYHFRVGLKDNTFLRKSKEYKILDVIKGGVRFTTKDLRECSQETAGIREMYEGQQKTIVNEVIRVAVGYLTPLTTLNFQLAQIDCLVSFAIAAKDAPIPYVRPKMLPEGSGGLRLKKVRHPCLELQEHISYIANDVDFRKGECTMYIITGPNMGGKSTFIRSVGIAVLMAHVGSFVPCCEAIIPIVDSILGRIGAGDNIAKGLSTFMVEMIETSTIIRTASKKSLVIIDELGRGTSTYDGCGLAWAIAEHLAQDIQCFTLFATHFHEIAELSAFMPTVKAYHMNAVIENNQFTLLYRLKPGIIERSFGINVAKLADFPRHIVEMAEEKYEEYEDHMKNMNTREDKELAKYVDTAVEMILQDENRMTNANIDEIMGRCKHRVVESGSNYFKGVFSDLFEM